MSKDIKGRLLKHYQASQNPKNWTRGEKHIELFSKHYEDTLTVYWIPLDDEKEELGEELRKYLENILHLIYKPTFILIKKVKHE